MSHRLLLAISDRALASSAVALAQEGEGLEVVDVVSDAEEVARALRRLDVDAVILHDALGAVPVLDLAREISASNPEVGIVLVAADESPELLRAAMQAGIRDVVGLPLSLERLEASVRQAAQWSRALRDRVAGEESAGGALGGPIVAVAGAKGGVGTTTVATQLALAAARATPGRPVCLVDFDLAKGDIRAFLETPFRRSVVDLVEVAGELSVRHLQETLYTHELGFRVLLAPDHGERAEDVDSVVARNVLTAVKARHALTVVDLGATPSEASAIGAEMATTVLVVTTPDVVALRGVQRLRDLWRRLQVREDDGVVVLLNRTSRKLEVQPDLARKVVGIPTTQVTIPDDFGAFEAAVNTGSPGRVEDGKIRGAFAALAAEVASPETDEDGRGDRNEPRSLLARLAGERGQSSVEFIGLMPILIVLVLAVWQVGLAGYTYILAGNAAREGARELSTDNANEKGDRPYRERAEESLPAAWRRHAEVTIDPKDEARVVVDLKIPVVLPTFTGPLHVRSRASGVTEIDELPPSQSYTPTPTPTPKPRARRVSAER